MTPPALDLDIEELRRVAGEATPGPWNSRHCPYKPNTANGVGDEWFIGPDDSPYRSVANVYEDSDFPGAANARYIAAVHPGVLVAILDRLQRAEGALEKICEVGEDEENEMAEPEDLLEHVDFIAREALALRGGK